MDSITWLGIFILFSMFILTPIYVLVALIICYYSTKKFKGKKRFLRFTLLAFIFYLPIGWDVLLGRGYFYYLCATDGGIHIYETVELGPEYWNEDGSPKFYTQDRGAFDESAFDDKYNFVYFVKDNFGKFVQIKRVAMQIIEDQTGKLIGEWIMYGYLGGWVMNSQPFGGVGFDCKSYIDASDNPKAKGVEPTIFRKFTSFIFLKNNIKEK